ncbi:MAG: 23S rRNA (pseudouridine(1915)-N(3))-methyltransferase RlmH [Deltaproteobacteria bacterium]|nr:MAG: 23S rRNA (pseudouridine(1915)-N(3))-methyltransferase RlmH [Deltaproteobacteria bacterium]
MKLTLLTVGKIKNESIAKLCEDYLGRAKHFFSLQSVDVKDCPMKGSTTVVQSQQKECDALMAAIPSGAKVILLDEKGKEFTTGKLSNLFQSWQNQSVKEVVFVIGGAYGLSEEIKKKYPEKMALSQLTLTHEMSRLLFLEQIYRVGTILKGMKYHH